MKTSNKIITIYAILTPIIIAAGFIATHDFSIDTKLRIRFTNPSLWEHYSYQLPEEDYSIVSANYTGVIFSDTVPPGSIGFRYVNPKLKPSYFVKNDTLFLWSLHTNNYQFYTAYFFLHPSEQLKFTANRALIKGNFDNVREISASLKSSNFIVSSGHLEKIFIDTATNSEVFVSADTLDGIFENSQIQLNEQGKFLGSINEKSKITLSQNPILASLKPEEFYDNTWDVALFFINTIIPINLSDSTYIRQMPPQ